MRPETSKLQAIWKRDLAGLNAGLNDCAARISTEDGPVQNSAQLTLVADRTMLRFVILHGHFEHVIASDADTMNLQRFLATVLPSGLIMLRCVRLAHFKILTCPAGRARILELYPRRVAYLRREIPSTSVFA
jgi:hypothetical protein